ncbi:MAG: toll/interleukin-1 receptor domain-containing protein [Vicinamibacterales bacterium]
MRDTVFFSYSHADLDALKDFEKMLAPALQGRKIRKWSDRDIVPGSRWREDIGHALDSTAVAVLLVSPDFLSSDFIQKHELPTLLEGAANQELAILWIYLRPCMYKLTPIADYQAAHDISKPLSLMTPRRREQVILEVCERIQDTWEKNGSPGPSLFTTAPAEAVLPPAESSR